MSDASGAPLAGGDDHITSGSGRDWIVAGLGADTVTAGAGDNILAGDHGEITFAAGQVVRVEDEIQAAHLGGDDEIVSGAGADIVLAGLGSDRVLAGDGDNFVFADHGRLMLDGASRRPLSAETGVVKAALGGDDVVETGAGFDWIFGGQGADTLTDASGGAAILGDNGRILAHVGGGASILDRIETRESAIGGGDVIAAGDGTVIAFGGHGGDSITTAGGDDVLLGDMGALDFARGVRALLVSEIEDPAHGGDDSIISGAGADWAILGEGDDSFATTAGLTVVLGDAGRISGDAMGVVLEARSLQNATGGRDTMSGGRDRDIFIGGAAGDDLSGNAGDDLMAGDGALFTRAPAEKDLRTFETTDIKLGGDDTLRGGAGLDVMFGGIGNDAFDLDLADDTVAGEFARIRLLPRGDGTELVTSFLTPSVRDIDLLAQLSMGINFAATRTEIRKAEPSETPEETGEEVEEFPVLAPDMRLDLLLFEADLAGDAFFGGLVSSRTTGPGEAPVPGLFGFGGLSAPTLLTALPATPEGTPEQQAEPTGAAPQESGGTAPAPDEGDTSAESPEEARMALPRSNAMAELDGNVASGGWRMTGWRVNSSSAVT